MKKKLLAIIAVLCIAVLALTACGGGGGAASTQTDSGDTPAAADTDSSGGGSSAAAETFDVGSFTVAVPAGWTAFPQSDIFGEQDEDGNYPTDPDSIVIAKGASDEWSALTGPSVRIYYYTPDAYVMDSRDFYDDVQEIDGVKVNGIDCSAFSGDSLGYLYQFVSYVPEDAQYDISILTSIDGKDTGIKWDDADVMTIMESLKAK